MKRGLHLVYILTNWPKKQEKYKLSKGNRMWSMELVRSSWRTTCQIHSINWPKKALYLSVNVFSTKVFGGYYFTGDETTTLCGHPSHAKVWLFVVQRQYLHFSVFVRPWVLVRAHELYPWPPALHSSTLPTELILLQCKRSSRQINLSFLKCSASQDSSGKKKLWYMEFHYLEWCHLNSSHK